MAKKTIVKVLQSPFGLQLTSLSFLVFFVVGFYPSYVPYGQIFSENDFFGDRYFEVIEPGFLENRVGVNTAGMKKITVKDENGNLIERIVPRKRDKEITYIVKAGDNITKIAHRFGLKVSTILWANNLTVKSHISPDQKLRIPPTDGVFYRVKKGETLSEIAKRHEIELSKVQAYNHLTNKIKAGQEIFLPEAKKIFVQNIAVTRTAPHARKSSLSRYISTNEKSNAKIGTLGFRFRRPTRGVITQRFHKGHYAIDIANVKNTPIYAAADGIVVKESHSGWNYGYGRYLVIDHGNGVQTLYAHANVTKVGVGEKVKRGQLIALMGNTGNVFGKTGIHLHFEIRIRGRKVNPLRYFEN